MDIFCEKDIPTIFNRYNIMVFLSPSFSGQKGEKDFKAYEAAMANIGSKENIFVMFGDLDNIAHTYGIRSHKYLKRINDLDGLCENLIKEFRRINGDKSEIIILSDHGMAEVTGSIRIDPEEKLGPAGPKSYFYFIDSTFLRIWLRDGSRRTEVEDYLAKLSGGRLLSDPHRKHFGITDKKFGDYIYLIDEGNVFFPDFMGGRRVKAMHGYFPENDSQKGIFLHLGSNSKLSSISAMDAYRTIDYSLSH